MENIIITVTNTTKTYRYDLEVPTTVTLDKLKVDMVEALNGFDSNLRLDADSVILHCGRIRRRLYGEETFASAGIWNGDYITITEVN